MKIHTIDTGLFKLDGGAMFGVVPKSMWQKLNPPDANNMCTWAMRCLLIEDGGRLLLIDNGIGDKQDEKFRGHFYLHGDDTLEKSLRKLGFTSADITDVFLTHLHFDHCGGSVQRRPDGALQLAFPNATYWSNEAHWDWAVTPNPREKASFLKENILPIQESGHLKFIDLQKGVPDALPQFREIILADGHTEKMMVPVMDYKGPHAGFYGRFTAQRRPRSAALRDELRRAPAPYHARKGGGAAPRRRRKLGVAAGARPHQRGLHRGPDR